MDHKHPRHKAAFLIAAAILIILIAVLFVFQYFDTAKRVKRSTADKSEITLRETDIYESFTQEASGSESLPGMSEAAQNESAETASDTDNILEESIVNSEKISTQIETSENLVKPGKNTLQLNALQGFTQKKNNKRGNSNAPKGGEDSTAFYAEPETVKISLSDKNLKVESIGSYMGSYLEDGSDEPVEDVAAIVVTNHSDRMLQVGDISFNVNEKETAQFRITNLLPDTSVIVLEQNRRKYSDADDYSYGEVANAYLEPPSLMESTFSFEKENGKLKIRNKTGQAYGKVYVYYKYVQSGGAYLGGITYRVPFENIKPNGTADSKANHFNKNTSLIVDVRVAD